MIILYALSGFHFKQKQKEKGSMTCHSALLIFISYKKKIHLCF